MLRVESQVFLVVNGGATAADASPGKPGSFESYGRAVVQPNGKWRPAALPQGGKDDVLYRGSTTNPAYDNANSCSPLPVTWNVRNACQALDIRTLNTWCQSVPNNPFAEKEGNTMKAISAHGARVLVGKSELLSKID